MATRGRVIEAQSAAAHRIRPADGRLSRIAVDTHVHLHPMFNRARFLDAALANAQAVGATHGLVWLLLTEIAGVHAFRELAERPPDGWRATLRAEGCTLDLRRVDGAHVLATAGRQVQVEGGLELLVLGSDADIPDGVSLIEGMACAAAAAALPVIPWGFGKWWGRRGRRLAELLHSPHGNTVFLGDNGNRASFWPEPAYFDHVMAAGRRVLPGSDPLPFEDQVNRVASYGLIVTMDIEGEAPFAALQALLLDPRVDLPTYGHRADAFTFIRDQVAMQIVRRRDG